MFDVRAGVTVRTGRSDLSPRANKGMTPVALANTVRSKQLFPGTCDIYPEKKTKTKQKGDICKLVQVTEWGWCFRAGRGRGGCGGRKGGKERKKRPGGGDAAATCAKQLARMLESPTAIGQRKKRFRESARVQTVMNHRFGLYVPQEVLAQGSKKNKTKKNNCLPPKPNRLFPFLSRRSEGVFKEPLIHSCNMLTVGRVRENTRPSKAHKYCTQPGASRP